MSQREKRGNSIICLFETVVTIVNFYFDKTTMWCIVMQLCICSKTQLRISLFYSLCLLI